jgi:hypothetical protein
LLTPDEFCVVPLEVEVEESEAIGDGVGVIGIEADVCVYRVLLVATVFSFSLSPYMKRKHLPS